MDSVAHLRGHPAGKMLVLICNLAREILRKQSFLSDRPDLLHRYIFFFLAAMEMTHELSRHVV